MTHINTWAQINEGVQHSKVNKCLAMYNKENIHINAGRLKNHL